MLFFIFKIRIKKMKRKHSFEIHIDVLTYNAKVTEWESIGRKDGLKFN
jgi:hypothetical protein